MSIHIDDFKAAARLGACLSRDYAGEAFRLLAAYRSLSASELASRLDLHIQTAQDFLETLAELSIAVREEASEGKRPYFRYSLRESRLRIDVDLAGAASPAPVGWEGKLREKKNAAVRFGIGRDHASIGHVLVWTGEGRAGRERKISLTRDQGRFLFHLPFPTAEPASMEDIMSKAGVGSEALPEIVDLLQRLHEHGVIERFDEKQAAASTEENKQ